MSSSPSTGQPAADTSPVGRCSQRRTVLAALPGVVLLPGVLAACGAQEPPPAPATVQSSTSVPAMTIPAAEVPVGTAKQVKTGSQYVIVAQPTAGKYVAFSATCTHKGGTVQVVRGMSLRCPLHGAEYDAATGGNTAPPAPRPLDRVPVALRGDQLALG